MVFGVDYYPEHWEPRLWEKDARWISESGLEIVRIGEFAWAKIEPKEGQFDFAWLDKAIETFARYKVRVILGTPTGAPPIWLSYRYPETLPVDEEGHRYSYGGRRHYCPNSQVYREFSQRIISRLAQRYGQSSAVAGWQIDNEFGESNTGRCYCPNCASAFRNWLRHRYKSLAALNSAWGSVFWSQVYTEWDQILPPIRTVNRPNPGTQLDYARFCSDSILSYHQMQVELLRELVMDGQWVTHNFLWLSNALDFTRIASSLDFSSYDSYPTGFTEQLSAVLYGRENPLPEWVDGTGDPAITGFFHNLTFGLSGKPFWIMEQQAGNINWGMDNQALKAGTLRLWIWHAIASGARGILFFRERACPFGQEIYHSGLRSHDDSPTPALQEIKNLIAESKELLQELADQPRAAKIALLYDYESWWALQNQPHNLDFNYLKLLFTYYAALQRLGLAVDVIHSGSPLETYRLVIAPCAHFNDPGLAGRLAGLVQQGGVVLLGIRSGFMTAEGQASRQTLPGVFRKLVGATVREWSSLPAGRAFDLYPTGLSIPGKATIWAEWLAPKVPAESGEPEVLARYGSGFYAGRPAFVRNTIGAGGVYYLGWHPTIVQAEAICRYLAGQVALDTCGELPAGVLISSHGAYTLLMNFTNQEQQVYLSGVPIRVSAGDIHIVRC